MNSSIGASKAAEGLSVYNATKAAIRSFARTWTVELKDRKILVNAVSPGSIDTPIFNPVMSKEEYEQFKNNVTKSIPMGRMGNPDEVAKAVSFLASDDSSYITCLRLRRISKSPKLTLNCINLVTFKDLKKRLSLETFAQHILFQRLRDMKGQSSTL